MLSVGFHLVLFLVVVLGLPIFWEPEPLPEAIGVELAQLSDITAAPKVDKAGKPEPKPNPPSPAKEEPQKEAPPPKPNPPAPSAPPPPPVPEEIIPAEKPIEEKKKIEEKKPEPPQQKPKQPTQETKKDQKPSDQELDNLLKNVLQDQTAPETPTPPKKTTKAPPPSASTGPQTANISEIPMTASEEDGIRAQIEKNWNLGSALGSPDLKGIVIELRIELQPDGTVTKVTVLNASLGNPFQRTIAESARRAVMIASPLKLPPGKSWPTMRLRFYPEQAAQ